MKKRTGATFLRASPRFPLALVAHIGYIGAYSRAHSVQMSPPFHAALRPTFPILTVAGREQMARSALGKKYLAALAGAKPVLSHGIVKDKRP